MVTWQASAHIWHFMQASISMSWRESKGIVDGLPSSARGLCGTELIMVTSGVMKMCHSLVLKGIEANSVASRIDDSVHIGCRQRIPGQAHQAQRFRDRPGDEPVAGDMVRDIVGQDADRLQPGSGKRTSRRAASPRRSR